MNWKRSLYILFFVQMMSALGFSSCFSFLSLYVQELKSVSFLSKDLLVGLAYSSQAFTMMFASSVWGAMADRHGRKLMVARATFGAAVLIFLMAFVRSAEELIFLRALQGTVSGVMPAIAALVIASVPRERSGYAMGMIQVALWGGLAFGPLMGGVIADSFGYPTTFIVTSALLSLSGVVLWFGVEEQFSPSPVAVPDSAKHQKAGNLLRQYREILKLPGVVPAYSVRAMNWLARTMINPFVPLFVASLMAHPDHVATTAGLVTGGAALSSTVSAMYMGRLGDRIGHRQIIIAGSFFAAVFYLPQYFVTDIWQLVILQILTGAAYGALMPTLSALLAQYTPHGGEGTVYGMEHSINSGMRAAAPMLGASIVFLLDIRGVFLGTGLVFLLGTLVAIQYLPDTPPVVAEHNSGAPSVVAQGAAQTVA